jgi:hypothetical protein
MNFLGGRSKNTPPHSKLEEVLKINVSNNCEKLICSLSSSSSSNILLRLSKEMVWYDEERSQQMTDVEKWMLGFGDIGTTLLN